MNQSLNHSKQQSRLPRYLQFSCLLLALILMVWGGYLFWQRTDFKHYFKFTHVQIITETKHIRAETLAHLIAQNLEGGFFSLKTDKLEQKVLRNPWINHVAFRRVWPGTLQVSVTERIPIARWKNYAVIGSDDELFIPPQNEIPASLPELSGPVSSLDNVLALYKKLIPLLPIRISALVLDQRGAWHLVLEDKYYLTLGQNEILTKVKRFTKLYPTILQNNKTKKLAIDLRYTNGAAVRVGSGLDFTPQAKPR